ncbi:MAG: Rrf2 family transcriptional regulator [Christensenella sp.]|nr:Rrf2 family transcriptional regulator [Christensenella sp.]
MTADFTIAVHALVYLNHKKTFQNSELLAKNVCTHPARIRKVMSVLKKAGLVEAKEGIDGGYAFCRDPKEVSLRQIADGMNIPFVSASWHSGNINMECLISSGMADIMDGVYATLDLECRKALEKITIDQIDHKIFG